MARLIMTLADAAEEIGILRSRIDILEAELFKKQEKLNKTKELIQKIDDLTKEQKKPKTRKSKGEKTE